MSATDWLKRGTSAVNLWLSSLPSVLIVLFTVEAVWLRWSLGRWPTLYRDNPVDDFGKWLDLLTGLGFMALFVSVPLWALSLAGAWSTGGRRRALLRTGTYLGAIALLILAFVVNPFGFPSWWID
jgi:hypothetical protein